MKRRPAPTTITMIATVAAAVLAALSLPLGMVLQRHLAPSVPAPAPAVSHGPAPATPPATRALADRPEVRRFAEDMARRNGMDETAVRQMLASARIIRSVRTLVLPQALTPGARKNWTAYRTRFVEPVRVRAGVQFWQEHADALQRAQERFGVPASIIAGVIGMETLYGQQLGQFRVLDALATLAFDFPREHPRAEQRQQYFARELEEYLLTAREQRIAPDSLRGSHSGDMGLPQFMPSSWARYGVDFDGDGHIDLWSASDAIGSVANYLQGHGWIAGLPAHYEITHRGSAQELQRLLDAGIRPSFPQAELRDAGVDVDRQGDIPDGILLSLIALENGSSEPIHIAGTQNFLALTKYNPSRYYALAVIQLGQAIERARLAR